jgi:predicted nucleic acid-binding protein
VADLAGVNASPVIVLARANHFDLLKLAADRVVVPRAVVDEIHRRGPGDPAVDALAISPWLEVVDTPPVPPDIAAYDLGPGESALLTWGTANPTAILVLDDLAARRCATTLGLTARGTLSLVTSAKQQGIIPAAAPVIDDVRRAGLYVSDGLVRRVLASVGE